MPDATRTPRAALTRILAAIAVALAFSLGVYLLIEATQPDGGLISFTFLLILPAAVCAFVAYVADPWKQRSRSAYLRVPLWILGAVVAASIVFLREGTICILMLAPVWLLSGCAGALITYKLRRRVDDGRTYSLAVLALPLIAMQIEPLVTLPTAETSVTRSTVIAASPRDIWPLLRGVPDVRPGEGTWNVSQDVIGIPRPLGAHLVRDGVGADRYARWGDGIRFRERIIAWQPGRHIGWRFLFDDIAGWAYTDRHLMPDSPYFRITTGGYRMEPLADGRTRVTLYTKYRITTPVNPYAELWGQLVLGDLENNILTVIRHRAELSYRRAGG